MKTMQAGAAGRFGRTPDCVTSHAGVPGSNPADPTSVLNSSFELKMIEILLVTVLLPLNYII